jgi:hypothetical protein
VRDERPAELWPDAVWILNKGSLVWFRPYDEVVMERTEPDAGLMVLRALAPRDVLLTLVMQLHQDCVTAWSPPFRVHDYLRTAVVGIPDDRWLPVEPSQSEAESPS